jgi:hypothetical protein
MKHQLNCCVKHGCYYGQEHNCPVWLGYEKQSHFCDDCRIKRSGNIPCLPTVGEQVIENRRMEISMK